MRHALAMVVVGVGFVAGTAWADGTIDAKVQCQVEFGSRSEMGAACLQGVDFARRAQPKTDPALACTASPENGARVTACQRGVALYERFGGQVRSTDKSSFSYTWRQPKTGFQIDIGDYQASVGNQKVMEDCMQSFDGSKTPSSCTSGITIQPKAPAPPPK